MKDTSILLHLINILSDGRFYYCKYISKVLSINKVVIKQYVEILLHWGVEVLIFP